MQPYNCTTCGKEWPTNYCPECAHTIVATGIKTALHKAVEKVDFAEVKDLLGKGFDVNSRDEAGQTALHYAAGDGCTNMVKLLLEHGANINATDVTRRTPLDAARANHNHDVAELLRGQGALDTTDALSKPAPPASSIPASADAKAADASLGLTQMRNATDCTSAQAPAMETGLISVCNQRVDKVGSGQKILIAAIAIHIMILVGMVFVPLLLINLVSRSESVVGLLMMLVLGFLLLEMGCLLATFAGLFRIGSGLALSGGTLALMSIAMFIPFVNVLTLLVVNGKATGFLRQSGYRVGLLGAETSTRRRMFSCPECGKVSWLDGVPKRCPHCLKIVGISNSAQNEDRPLASIVGSTHIEGSVKDDGGKSVDEETSQRRHHAGIALLAPAIVFLGIGAAWLGFSLYGSAPPKESLREAEVPKQANKLPQDLVGVTGVQYASLDSLAPGSREAQERQRQAALQLELPLEVKTRKTGIAFRLVPTGTFTMGSPANEAGRDDDETQHQVTLSEPFYCGKFEVTRGQWEQVMGSNPSQPQNAGTDAPVELVSWDDCQAFVKRLCQIEGVVDGTYRLLTEAEWEYACRAGTTTAFCYGNDLDSSMANFDGDYPYGTGRKGEKRAATVRVGSFRPNAWGLYDMHGNVCEWCQDIDAVYRIGPPSSPLGFVTHVVRGGDRSAIASHCRSARSMGLDNRPCGGVGLRLARAMSVERPATQSVLAEPTVSASLQRPEPVSSLGETKPAAPAVPVTPAAPGQNWSVPDLEMVLVYVEPGSFQMGSNGGNDDEKPVRTVRITRAFWMGKCEVTQAQYQAVMGTNPGFFKGSDLPVENVSWDDAVAFCDKLTERERRAGRLPQGYVYRLPTEAEWEYAARGGNKGRGFEYAGSSTLDQVAWNGSNANNKTHPVGQRIPNELGLYDMSGNVWEWCHDIYEENYYANNSLSDPTGPRAGVQRVLRGGSWDILPKYCRVTFRGRFSPDRGGRDTGFRVVASWPLD